MYCHEVHFKRWTLEWNEPASCQRREIWTVTSAPTITYYFLSWVCFRNLLSNLLFSRCQALCEQTDREQRTHNCLVSTVLGEKATWVLFYPLECLCWFCPYGLYLNQKSAKTTLTKKDLEMNKETVTSFKVQGNKLHTVFTENERQLLNKPCPLQLLLQCKHTNIEADHPSSNSLQVCREN